MGNLTHRPRRSIAVLVSLAALALSLAVISRPIVPARADDSQDITIAEAAAQAADTGQPVLATAATKESGSVVANPDGTLTATLGAGPLQEPDASSSTGWSPIDLTLQHVDGTYAPAVSAADTTFSDGGSGALASLDQGSTTYTENWDGTLPTPTVSGDTATYANVLPNIDIVMTAQTTGFKQSFVVKVAPTSQLTLDVPLSLRGLTATVDDNGNLIVTDAAGNTVATAGTAVMYGAAVGPTGEPTISTTVDTAIVDGQHGPVFEISPDPSFFSNPELTYPVTIDPSPNLDVTTDTYVRQSTPTTSYLTENGLKVGLVATSDITRALLKFPALDTTYRGNSNAIDVSSATLNLYEVDSGSCTASEIDLYEATSNWITAGGPTWNAPPTIGTLYASASFAAGHSGCSAAAETISTGGASGHTLADLVQNWADGSTNNGFELRAANESATSDYKKFRSSEYGSNPPTMSVTYNTLPSVPTSLSVSDGTTWTPTLHALFSDPDGGTGHVVYSVYDSNSTYLTGGSGSTVSSGSDSPLTLSGLVDPDTLSWTAVGTDGTETSSATSSQSLDFNPSNSDLTTCTSDINASEATFQSSGDATEIADTSDGYQLAMTGPDGQLDDSYCVSANAWGSEQGATSPSYLYATKGDRPYYYASQNGQTHCTVHVFGNERLNIFYPYDITIQAKVEFDCGGSGTMDLWALYEKLYDNNTGLLLAYSSSSHHIHANYLNAASPFVAYPSSTDYYYVKDQIKLCFPGESCRSPVILKSKLFLSDPQ